MPLVLQFTVVLHVDDTGQVYESRMVATHERLPPPATEVNTVNHVPDSRRIMDQEYRHEV